MFEFSAALDPPLRGFELTCEQLSTMTNTSPATIRVCLRNETERTREVAFGKPLPIRRITAQSRSSSHRLIVLSVSHPDADALVPDTPLDGCWRVREGSLWESDAGLAATMAPGDELCGEYVILEDPDAEACFPPGSYTVSDTIQLGDPVETTHKLSVTIDISKTESNGETPR